MPFALTVRPSLGWVGILLRTAGLDWRVSDFSTLSWRQKALRLQLPYLTSTTALILLVDSRGIKCVGEGERKRTK